MYTHPMIFLRQHIFLIMLVTVVLLFSMTASHCAWIAQVLDTPSSSSLLFSQNELAEDSQEGTHTSTPSFLPSDALVTNLTASRPVLLSVQRAPDDQAFHLPQIYFDIFVPPQKLS
ncbi:hypothetical protein SAMN02745119_02734 [Trichlorobacter thiogenes]|uniref:Uncharacterized protein n=2 Tax=Trichlorobacter thiogenes TaxID=115783 RepID=A0A1T4R8V4_9BACT|nr:hypothetical protein SAMN02745119_02734 [Trichlorobacter thiogenes]